MNEYKKIVLGISARSYIEKCLGYGCSLSKYILDYIDLKTGQIIVELPEQSSFERIEDYDHGILPEPPKAEWYRVEEKDGTKSVWVPIHPFKKYIIGTIRSFLISDQNNICIIEDPMAKPTDEWLHETLSNIIQYQNEIYHLIRAGEHSNSEIEGILNQVNVVWPPLTGFLISLPIGQGVNITKQELKPILIKTMAENLEKLFVKAYDGETYLIWHKYKEI